MIRKRKNGTHIQRKAATDLNYVISDLHGQYDSYEKLLKKIHFTDDDTLYLLGDVLDYGDGGLRILNDAMGRSNVFPILGDHEMTAARLLHRMRLQEQGKKPPSAAFQKEFSAWITTGGGMPTVTAFRLLNDEEQDSVLEYLREECVPYELAEVGKKTFLLVHAGIPAGCTADGLDDCPVKELITGHAEFPQEAPEGMTLVTGHTPTEELDEENGGRALFSEHHIAIDCGAADGGFACCLCLDDGTCHYA